ncbi:putative ABC transporter type 1, transmembrane domain superfamily [Helianthus annuus]|uniref:ABC transporter type 1, transmembrane domain superfamily n=1 Tax=Helianthus annuus TaxID=4232 RepID=A0A9K3DY44_HELAN|nr:putative ABC transporter type 1, transmembrane domain superfamily [Helianthus annuus]KAJ0471482.1 putative ABC transporter type 1, transmembrane domain superfamily [Helianthus annuus]
MNGGGEEKTEVSTVGTGDGVEDSELGKAKEKESTETVPFYKLFAFADLTDYMLMIVGTVSAIANGVCLPLMTLLLGDLINSFGHNQSDDNNVVDVVSKVSILYITCNYTTRMRGCFVHIIIPTCSIWPKVDQFGLLPTTSQLYDPHERVFCPHHMARMKVPPAKK